MRGTEKCVVLHSKPKSAVRNLFLTVFPGKWEQYPWVCLIKADKWRKRRFCIQNLLHLRFVTLIHLFV